MSISLDKPTLFLGEGGRAAGNRQLSIVTIKVMKVVARMKYLLSFQLILAKIVAVIRPPLG